MALCVRDGLCAPSRGAAGTVAGALPFCPIEPARAWSLDLALLLGDLPQDWGQLWEHQPRGSGDQVKGRHSRGSSGVFLAAQGRGEARVWLPVAARSVVPGEPASDAEAAAVGGRGGGG